MEKKEYLPVTMIYTGGKAGTAPRTRPPMPDMLQWKKNLKEVMDNPDYMEEKMTAINKELRKNEPSTEYLREKIRQMLNWTFEIDLANDRAKAEMRRVM